MLGTSTTCNFWAITNVCSTENRTCIIISVSFWPKFKLLLPNGFSIFNRVMGLLFDFMKLHDYHKQLLHSYNFKISVIFLPPCDWDLKSSYWMKMIIEEPIQIQEFISGRWFDIFGYMCKDHSFGFVVNSWSYIDLYFIISTKPCIAIALENIRLVIVFRIIKTSWVTQN